MIPRAETTDLDHLMDPSPPRECDKCRADCDHGADLLAWTDVQMCVTCAEAAVEASAGTVEARRPALPKAGA